MPRRSRIAVPLLLALSSLAFAAAASGQDGTSPGGDVVGATSPDGLVTVYAAGGALPPGVQLVIQERSPQEGPRELRRVEARAVLYRLGPSSTGVETPLTIVRSYRTQDLGFESDGVPIISQAIKGPGGWGWLDDQRVLTVPAESEDTSLADRVTRAQMGEFLRRSLGLAADDFRDPFDDPTIDLVVAGTTASLGDLIGIGGGAFLSQEPDSPVQMSVGDRRALRGRADVNRAFGGRTTGLVLIVEPPDVAMIKAQALYADRSYAAVIGCEMEGEALTITELTLDRLARRVSLFEEGPLAALSDGAGSRVYIAHPVACLP